MTNRPIDAINALAADVIRNRELPTPCPLARIRIEAVTYCDDPSLSLTDLRRIVNRIDLTLND